MSYFHPQTHKGSRVIFGFRVASFLPDPRISRKKREKSDLGAGAEGTVGLELSPALHTKDDLFHSLYPR